MQKNLYNEAGNCINCTDAGYDQMSDNDHIHDDRGCRMFIGLCLVVLLVIAVCITRTFYK